MSVNFGELFPAVSPALEALAHIPLVQRLTETAWVFALVETGHLLFLTVLGGSVFALNLRLLDLVLTDVPVEDVERATRPWYRAGVIGTIATGVAMAATTASTLLPSEAFFIKMASLLAAIVLSQNVARQVRDSRASQAPGSIVAIAAGFSIWLGALFLFATTAQLNSGSLLVALAGAALFSAAAQRHHRVIVASLSVVVLTGWYLSLDAVGAQDGGGSFASLGNGVAAVAVMPVLGIAVRDIRVDASGTEAVRKLTAFSATLAWITVAAAGRWIGFS